MKKLIKPMNLIFLILVLFIFISKFYTDNKENNRKIMRFRLKKDFVLKEIIKRRGYFLVCSDINNHEIFEVYPSSELLENIIVGDTIYKKANSNNCLIINRNKRVEVKCYPDDMVANVLDNNK